MKPRHTPPTEGLVGIAMHVLFVFFILRGARNACKMIPRLWLRQKASGESRHPATSENKTTTPPWISCPSVKIETVSGFAHRLEQNRDRGSELSPLAQLSASILVATLNPAIRLHAWCEGMLVGILLLAIQTLGWPRTWFCGYLNRLTPDQETRFLDAMRRTEESQAMSESCREETTKTGRQTQLAEKCWGSLDVVQSRSDSLLKNPSEK